MSVIRNIFLTILVVILLNVPFVSAGGICQSSADDWCAYDCSTGILIQGVGATGSDCSKSGCSKYGDSLGLCLIPGGEREKELERIAKEDAEYQKKVDERSAKHQTEIDKLGAESDAIKYINEKINNNEAEIYEVSCSGLTDPRVVEKIKKTKDENAKTGEDTSEIALTEDNELYYIKLADSKLTCFGFRETEVKEVKQENLEVSGKLEIYSGTVKILRNGIVTDLKTGQEIQTGDTIKADGIVGFISKDGTIQLNKDTVVRYVGLTFDPVPDRRFKPIPEAPWAPDPGSFKYEIDNKVFWEDLAKDMKKHVPKLLSLCLQSLAGAPNPLDPGVPLPPAVGCAQQHIVFLLDGSLWTKSNKPKKDTKNFDREWIFTKTILINHMTTEFTVEVNDESTTVTTIEGSVLVTDLESHESVVVNENEQIKVPAISTGLKEQELKDSITVIDSVDRWWNEESVQKQTSEIGGLQVILYLGLGAVFWGALIYFIIKSRKKKKK